GSRPSIAHLEPDIKLNGDETIDTGIFKLQVIWTPGHSPGHICLYDAADKIFFAGDHILPVITPNIGLPPHSTANPLGDFIKSLSELKKLDVKIVLPAHEKIFYDLGKRIDGIIHHHEVRKGEIMKALDSTGLTAYQISNSITWMPDMGGVKFENLWAGEKRAAVSETLAHLRAMEVDGQVRSQEKQGVTYYHRA
ncbi:MAG: MBL fold metallo-hydrolase, partial [Dehalococcoidales bacterium]|nr:MBL fold metallo-hydrolase [Dehalococcoidales bacterium]